MKNESVTELLNSGEIQMTDDVLFMVECVIEMFERGMDSDSGAQFVGFGLDLLNAWRESLASNSGKLELSDEAIANIFAGTAK